MQVSVCVSGVLALNVPQYIDNMNESERKELVEKLNKETDEFIQKMYSKNKDYKYDDGITEGNIDEILSTHPAFMTRQPTQEEIDRSPMLQALQALQYDDPDDTPSDRANAYKKDGNFHFKCKKYEKACLAYTEALQCKCDDTELNAVLFSNRAAANYYLQNYRLSLLDASQAVKLCPSRVKSLLRCAQCCEALKRFANCIQWCEVILSLDENHETAREILTRAKKFLRVKQRDERKRQIKKKNNAVIGNVLLQAIKSRGVTLGSVSESDWSGESDAEDSADSAQLKGLKSHGFSNFTVHLDDCNNLIWPVLFVYPEFKTTDFVEQFDETSSFLDHLSVMFEQKADWDLKHEYKVDFLEVYFENVETGALQHVNVMLPLARILSDKNYIVQRGCPNFYILSSMSSYKNTFLDMYNRA